MAYVYIGNLQNSPKFGFPIDSKLVKSLIKYNTIFFPIMSRFFIFLEKSAILWRGYKPCQRPFLMLGEVSNLACGDRAPCEVKAPLDARTCSGKGARSRTSSDIRAQIIGKRNDADNLDRKTCQTAQTVLNY